jgi:hypothetical protein
MILQYIQFHKNGHSLQIYKLSLQSVIIVKKDGKTILEIESELAPLVGDCLKHIGVETDFLGLQSHMGA